MYHETRNGSRIIFNKPSSLFLVFFIIQNRLLLLFCLFLFQFMPITCSYICRSAVQYITCLLICQFPFVSRETLNWCVCVQVLYMCACTGRQFNFHFCDITAPLGTRTIIEYGFITWLYYIYRSSRWKYGRDVTRTRKPYYRWLKKVSLSTLSAFTLTTVVCKSPSESTLIIERRCCRCLSILQGPINEPTSSSLIITRAIVRFRH